MHKEIADLWTDALKSGEYEQATGVLAAVDPANGDIIGYCCLGVLCELAVKAGVKVTKSGPRNVTEDEEDPYWDGVAYDDNEGVLPPVVKEWAGIKQSDGAFDRDGENTLVAINDSGNSFSFIADVIQKNVEVL